MGEIDYGEIQQVLDDLLGQNVDFQNMAEQGASGNSPISFQNLLKMAEGLFFRELMEQKELWDAHPDTGNSSCGTASFCRCISE